MEAVQRLLLCFVIFGTLVQICNCQDWKPPYFNCENAGETVECDASGNRFKVSMDEENEEGIEFRIVDLTYNGETEPIFESFLIGSSIFLDAKFNHDSGGNWYIFTTKRQDYENKNQQEYLFNVLVGEERQRLHLEIRNIDDNDPIVETQSCSVEEYQPVNTETTCKYTITDVDGLISTSNMNIYIHESNQNAKDAFKVVVKNHTENEYILTVTLNTTKELDYNENPVYVFTLVAEDSKQNRGENIGIVTIIDLPNKNPEWQKMFAVKRFNENETQNFEVLAVDGDRGIGSPIRYEITYPELYPPGLLNMNITDDGKISVDAIILEEEQLFKFNIIAINNVSTHLTSTIEVAFFVDDINNNMPNFGKDEYVYPVIPEERADAKFVEKIICHDKDMGENAEYSVSISSSNPPEAKDAFMIIPSSGYQRQEFTLAVINPELLDYDSETWQKIELTIESVETKTEEKNKGRTKIKIELRNWNDEVPEFIDGPYTANFNETEGAGYPVANIKAHDRDIGDEIEYSITGNAQNLFDINPESGLITIKEDVLFDYDVQKEIIVSLQIKDKLKTNPTEHPYEKIHIQNDQLIVTIEDVNNKPPAITMPTDIVEVAENIPKDEIIPNGAIRGTDPDTTADLEFEINWDKSYATKQGRRAKKETFENCMKIDTKQIDGSTRDVIGQLVAKEVQPKVTIDYEEFDMLHLAVVLTDKNQEIGIGEIERILTITILDENDNAPIWSEDTLNLNRSVREASSTDTAIGSILATDIDGPEFNVVRYRIEEVDPETKDWVKVDENRGELRVDTDAAIDADKPRDSVKYTIYATDCKENEEPDECHEVSHEIEIHIIDTNNKVPFAKEDEFNSIIEVFENRPTGYYLETISAHDLDRDRPYHNVTFTINYMEEREVADLFAVDFITGELTVNLKNNAILDRDVPPSEYKFKITLTDNYGQEGDITINRNWTEVHIILLDENDNAPLMPKPDSLKWSVSENDPKDTELNPNITAHDIDEPNTPNSFVHYKVLSTNRIFPDFSDENLILYAQSPDNISGVLYTETTLKGLYGTYDTLIEACDWGEKPMCSKETYELTVRPYNYMRPEFEDLTENQLFRMHLEEAMGGKLMLTNKDLFKDFRAIDNDGLEAGTVTFELTGNAKTLEYFNIANKDRNEAELKLKKNLVEEDTDFEVELTIRDNGTEPESYNNKIKFRLKFISMLGDILFINQSVTYGFKEGDSYKDQENTIEEAFDPKNDDCVGNDCFPIYYFIISGDKDTFDLNKENRKLTLKKPLDRNEALTHNLKIGASNNINGPGVIADNASLNVTINVKEVDPKPKFERPNYSAGLKIGESHGKSLLTVHATHSEDLTITYEILKETMDVSHSSLNSVKDNAFDLDPKTGELTTTFQTLAAFRGMFKFKVEATDEATKTDQAEVRIYIISPDNQVEFIFNNAPNDVILKKEKIREILSDNLGYTCNIDDIKEALTRDDKTSVVVHFIDDDDLPVPKETIENKLSDSSLSQIILLRMQQEELYLETLLVDTNKPPDSLEKQLRIILIVVSSVLGALVIVLLVAYCIRTRSLNKRLEALSTTKFGSQDSGLNRVGVAVVPGTNKHAVEGSNPVYNEEIKAPQFDAISNDSGDSDLIGVEDDPHFSYNIDNESAKRDSNS